MGSSIIIVLLWIWICLCLLVWLELFGVFELYFFEFDLGLTDESVFALCAVLFWFFVDFYQLFYGFRANVIPSRSGFFLLFFAAFKSKGHLFYCRSEALDFLRLEFAVDVVLNEEGTDCVEFTRNDTLTQHGGKG